MVVLQVRLHPDFNTYAFRLANFTFSVKKVDTVPAPFRPTSPKVPVRLCWNDTSGVGYY